MWEKGAPSRTATPAHRRWRAQVLSASGGVCALAYPGRCTGTPTEADHIVEVSDGGAEFDLANGQGVCTACHKHKTTVHANKKRWSQRVAMQPTETHPGLR